MLKTGLCSITFRDLSIDDVIATAQKAGLNGIEWGGDVHVTPGNIGHAIEVRKKTEDAGLTVCSYGSYFRCDGDDVPFSQVIETAKALGTSVIRVWAGKKGSADADQSYRNQIAATLRDMVTEASNAGLIIALEYHGGTLTDTQSSAHLCLSEVGLPELKLYWQPRAGGSLEEDIPELKAALPVLSHVHAFHWGKGGFHDRKPFREGMGDWKAYLDLIQQIDGDRFIIFEFTKDNKPEQLIEDAQALQELLHTIA